MQGTTWNKVCYMEQDEQDRAELSLSWKQKELPDNLILFLT